MRKYAGSPIVSPAEARRRRMAWTQRIRHVSQFAFAAVILSFSIQHGLSTIDGAVPSIDALCPFGGLETAWRYVSSAGQYVSKTHLSNLVLLGGLALGVLLTGGAFCGWVCPFGAVQDLLTWVRAKLHIRPVQVSGRVDRILRYGRFAMLGLILYQTIASVKLWFADWDPYRTLFGLGWLFEFNLAESWFAYAIVIVVLGASLFVERAWCRYACPLGGAISLAGNLSLTRIRREGDACKACNLCERPCPVKLPVATAAQISSDCIGCLACVDACPRWRALEVQLRPAWLEWARGVAQRVKPA